MPSLINAHPHLYGLSSGRGELLIKPGRPIERTAATVGPTPSSIPERRVREKPIVLDVYIEHSLLARIAEIVRSHKVRGQPPTTRDMRALANGLAIVETPKLVLRSREGPDVMMSTRIVFVAMSQAHAVHVIGIQGGLHLATAMDGKGVRAAKLIGEDSPAHFAVRAERGEGHGSTG